jgi:hypothetical protein
MPLTGITAYRIAGYAIDDEDFDENANLSELSTASRTLRINLPVPSLIPSGAGVSLTSNGVFPGYILPNANTGYLYFSIPLPTEYELLIGATLRILWNSAGTAGNLKITSDICTSHYFGDTASTETVSATQAATGTANLLSEMTFAFNASNFGLHSYNPMDEIIGIKIKRDPADGADTLASDVRILAITFEFTGRG